MKIYYEAGCIFVKASIMTYKYRGVPYNIYLDLMSSSNKENFISTKIEPNYNRILVK